jgi:hypothetical protein
MRFLNLRTRSLQCRERFLDQNMPAGALGNMSKKPQTGVAASCNLYHDTISLCTVVQSKANQNGTEQWSEHWNVHNFSRSTLISLRIFVAYRTLYVLHLRGFSYYDTHVLVATWPRHGRDMVPPLVPHYDHGLQFTVHCTKI